jgi:hypothetical protein
MLIARQARLPPELVQNALPYCDHLARLDVADIENQIKFWQREGMVDRRTTSADLLDLSFTGSLIRESFDAPIKEPTSGN